MKRHEGFTLVELAVSLAAIAVLAAVLTPLVSKYVDQSRVAAAQAGTKAIADAISQMERDLGRYPMFTTGSGFLKDSDGNVMRLEGPGATMMDTSGNVSNWVNGSTADDLADQLLSNAPGYPTTSSLAKSFKWKGPYLAPETDPWGNKYLVNITNAKSGNAYAVFVLSAGPDGVVDTPFNLSRTSAVSPSNDDILSRIK
jgi:prepilin-type N-terminal cleavage/methylation domain-containing protein